MTYPEGWHQASEERAERLADKLTQAVGEQHVLYGKHMRVVAYRHQEGMDELLCQHSEEEDLFTLLHLVWSLTSSETHRAAPIVEVHGCFQDFLNYEHDIQRQVISEVGGGLSFPLTNQIDHQLNSLQIKPLDQQLKEAEQRGEALGKQQGMQIGENRGLAVGEIQGQVKVLARQLCCRFRLTPTDALARLNGASSEQYEQWADNILTAQTLEQVFECARE